MKSWLSPSSCVWAKDSTSLLGRVSIAERYAKSKQFFLDMLNVPEPKLEMYIEALKQEALAIRDQNKMKQIITNICSFGILPTEKLKDLRQVACLPVILLDGGVRWMNCQGDFYIVDRLEYGRSFKGKIRYLDFTLEEVHSFECFLSGLNLNGRYLSQVVEYQTQATGTSLDRLLTSSLRSKAYAICRYVFERLKLSYR
jgi:hypothetical protein